MLNTCKLLKNCSFTWETRNDQFERKETCLPTTLVYSYLVVAVIQIVTHTNNFMFGDYARLSTVMFDHGVTKIDKLGTGWEQLKCIINFATN